MAGDGENSNARKSPRARSKRSCGKNSALKKTGKSRRKLFFKKNPPIKSPVAVATPVTSDRLYYKGSYFTKGDVVSVIDDRHRVYYAQIRGLLQDQYCEKSAVLTWLLPTRGSPKGRFDPATYILGPEEDIPRKLECLEFVCHAPSDYYKAEKSPYPTIPTKPESGFIWTRFGPKIVQLPYNGTSDSD